MGKDLLFRNPIKVTQDGVLFKQNARVIFHFKEVSALRKTPYNTMANILSVVLIESNCSPCTFINKHDVALHGTKDFSVP